MLICRGFFTIARASALTVAAIPSMRDELFDRSGLVNIRLSLLSLVERQLAFRRQHWMSAVTKLATRDQLQQLLRWL
jgi:hypothetical protein